MEKIVLITSFHVLVSRNILASPFLKLLKTAGFKPVIVCPAKKKDFFEREFGAIGAEIFPLENRLTRFDAVMKTLALSAVRTRSLKVMRKRGMGIEHPILFKIFFPFAPIFRSLIPLFYRLLAPRNIFADLFEKFKPAAVFSTDVFSANDCRIMLEARRRKVPILGMVRSWDNLTTKGGFRVVPDVLAVNNEIVRSEAIRLHHISPKIIRVVGIPHYDNYTPDYGADVARADFLKDLDLPEGAKYLLYAPLGDRIVKVGDQIIRHTFDRDIILRILKFLPEEYFLLVRLPPTDTVNLEGVPPDRIRIDRPGQNFGTDVKSVRATELSSLDDRRLVRSIVESRGVITVFSSISVDAAYLGRKVIMVGFDQKPVSYWESVDRIHEFDHLRPVIESGVFMVARNEEALKADISACVSDPVLSSAARQKIVEIEAYQSDSRASARLLEVLKELA